MTVGRAGRVAVATRISPSGGWFLRLASLTTARVKLKDFMGEQLVMYKIRV